MDQAEPPSPAPGLPPADFRRRAIARAIDLIVASIPVLLAPRGHPHAGELLCAALLLFGDSLFGPGRSLGKRLAGLRVVVVLTRRPAGMRESVLRNLPFALALIPVAIGASGQAFAVTLALVVVVETGIALRPLTRDLGQRRLGDLLAGTQVIDGRVALGLQAPIVRGAAPAATAPLASRAARQKETTECASR